MVQVSFLSATENDWQRSKGGLGVDDGAEYMDVF